MSDKWETRFNLISSFDSIIMLKDRARLIFNFDYIPERFDPKGKRKFGTYVLPSSRESNPVRRLDAEFDKDKRMLRINGVFAESGFEEDGIIGSKIADRLQEFTEFEGGEKFIYSRRKSERWAKHLA